MAWPVDVELGTPAIESLAGEIRRVEAAGGDAIGITLTLAKAILFEHERALDRAARYDADRRALIGINDGAFT